MGSFIGSCFSRALVYELLLIVFIHVHSLFRYYSFLFVSSLNLVYVRVFVNQNLNAVKKRKFLNRVIISPNYCHIEIEKILQIEKCKTEV